MKKTIRRTQDYFMFHDIRRKEEETKINYLIGGTWREVGADGVHVPFRTEIQAVNEEEAKKLLRLFRESEYKDILIKTVIANYRPKSKNQKNGISAPGVILLKFIS
jgi:hypothetical protein